MRTVIASLVLVTVAPAVASADEAVFSGPQVGEKLPPFTMRAIVGQDAGKGVDLVARADGKPTLLIFVHERTRPTFGLANALMRFASTRKSAGLVRGMIFLTDDATQTETWMNRIPQYFVKDAPVGISTDGAEGPGAYGLNRNVALTVLVGVEGQVTANFALVQPSVQADGPKILKAVVDVTGGGQVPDITEFAGRAMTDRRMAGDEKLRSLLRAVIQKDASEDDVTKTIAAVDEYAAGNKAVAKQLGEIAARVKNSRRFKDYGTAPAREAITKWAERYGPSAESEKSTNDPPTTDNPPSGVRNPE